MSSNIMQLETEETKKDIIATILLPEFKRDIKDAIKWRMWWNKIAITLQLLSKALSVIAALLAFCSPLLAGDYLALASGGVSIIALSVLNFSDIAFHLGINRTKTLNNYLHTLGIESFPEDIPIVSNAKPVINAPTPDSTTGATGATGAPVVNQPDTSTTPTVAIVISEEHSK